MTFHRVTPNAEYRALRLCSEGGNWELGMTPYSYGMRMRMGLPGRPPRIIDFCMGHDKSLFPKVLIAILDRLAPLEDSSTAAEIDQAFPWSGTRPDLAIHLQPLLSPGQPAGCDPERS